MSRGQLDESLKSQVFDLSQGPLNDSQFGSRLTQGQVTPANQSIISLEELSNLLSEGSFKTNADNTEEVMKELREQVRRSNASLVELGAGNMKEKLAGIVGEGSGRDSREELEQSGDTIKVGDNFVGEE